MRLTAILLVLAGCAESRTVEPHDAGSRDARPARDASLPDADPLAIPEICVEGWCFEQPLPAGPLESVWAASSAELWLSGPVVVRIEGGRATAFPELGRRILTGSGPGDVWAIAVDLPADPVVARFDGSTWQSVEVPFRTLDIHPISPTAAWAVAGDGVPHEWDGTRWIPRPLPIGVTPGVFRVARVVSIDATSPADVWASVELSEVDSRADVVSGRMTPMLFRWDGTAWGRIATPPSSTGPLRVFSDSDLWVGGAHWDGATWTQHADVYGVTGDHPHDLWANVPGARVQHWDGAAWSPTTISHVRSLSARSPLAWAVDPEGVLHAYARGAWTAGSRLVENGEGLLDVEARAAPDGIRVWAVTDGSSRSRVLARDLDGRWRDADGTLGGPGDVRALAASAHDDVWAFGHRALHHDGTAWRGTPIESVDPAEGWRSDLCSFGPGRAFVTSAPTAGASIRIFAWDGARWSLDGAVFTGDWSGYPAGRLRCFPDGSLWAYGGPAIAERTASGWRATPPLESLSALASWAAGPDSVWVGTDQGLLRWDGREWALEPREPLVVLASDRPPAVVAIDGASASDVVFVVSSDPPLLAHHDGTRVDRVTSLPPLGTIVGLRVMGPDDVLLVDGRLGVHRHVAGSTTTIAPAGATGAARAMLTSASDAWAVGDAGALLHFDGTSWSPVTIPGAPFVLDVRAFAADDVWALGGAGAAHWDGAAWATETWAGPSITAGARLGGPPGAVYVVTRAPDLCVRAAGWTCTPLPVPAHPLREIFGVAGAASDDLWIFATHVGRTYVLPWLYHWDGATVETHRAPAWVSDLRQDGGRLVARGETGVWERAAGRWVERPDLDPDAVFAPAVACPSFVDPLVSPQTQAAGRSWLVTGAMILRHD